MAGAGFKTFNTGDVLTASDVNTYLMQQTTMVFADASARSTALGANVAEGMISYLKDTNAVERYDGSSWGAIGAGDIEGVTAGTGLTGGGTSGTVTLSLDQANYGGGQWAAGKNKLINPDFYINQRNFSSTTTSNTYGHDRWTWSYSGGTCTYSNQTFTPGTAPVAGYEAKNFLRLVTSGQSAAGDLALFYQNIEDVRTLAGQTVTYSFWAKAASGTPKIAIETEQYFGTGGSPSATVDTYQGQITLTGGTSWTRYSISFTMPSISGKIIGTTTPGAVAILTWTSAGSNWNSRTGTLGIQNNTIDIWGVQLEAGSTATKFQTATGTIQGELAACQRYYYRAGAGNVYGNYSTGIAYSTTNAYTPVKLPVTMRTIPASIDFANLAVFDGVTFTALTSTSLSSNQNTPDTALVIAGVGSGLTQYRPYFLVNNNNTAGYIGFSAEL